MKKNLLLVLYISSVIFAACKEEGNIESVIACFNSIETKFVKLNEEIYFTNCSDNATSFFWDFGDGNTSVEKNPIHRFQSTGEFEIKLTASNTSSSDTTSIVISVYTIANEYKYYKISEALYPYLFDTASYWVYSSLDNNLIDSINLKHVDLDTSYIGPSGPGEGSQGEIHFYKLTYESSISGGYKEYLTNKYISKYYSDQAGFGPYIFKATQEIGDYSYNVKLNNIHSSMIVNNIIYYNIKEMEISKEFFNNWQDSIPDMNFYYVDSIGIIKKEIKENNTIIETWNLKDYHIEILENTEK